MLELEFQVAQENPPSPFDTKTRLGFVYLFAGTQIGYVQTHLDVGTYDGFGIEHLTQYAHHITSFDNDPDMIAKAKQNPCIQQLMTSGRLRLDCKDARQIDYPDSSFDSATCVEVFGAGFEGEEHEVMSVFEGVHRSLKPGGKLVFTVKSKTNEELFLPLNWNIPKGYPVHHSKLTTPLEELFSHVDWYGHMLFELTPDKRIISPMRLIDTPMGEKVLWTHEAFIPQHESTISRDYYRPMFWVGVCEK